MKYLRKEEEGGSAFEKRGQSLPSDGRKKKIDDSDMTLIFALNTGKEIYLASDGLGFYRKADGTAKFLEVEKYIKVSDNVEILFSGKLGVARAYYADVEHELWKKGLNEKNCDAREIATILAKFINPDFEDLVDTFSKPPFQSLVMRAYGSVSAFLKRNYWPLEIFVCGMDKDVNNNFSQPQIYLLNNNSAYKKMKFGREMALGGAPNVIDIAEPIFDDFQFLNVSDSPIKTGENAYSHFKKVIHKLKQTCNNEESPGVDEPIHIARISKDGYELLR